MPLNLRDVNVREGLLELLAAGMMDEVDERPSLPLGIEPVGGDNDPALSSVGVRNPVVPPLKVR